MNKNGSGINSALLKLKIKERGLKLKTIKDELGMSYYTLATRVNGKSPFTVSEIKRLCELLGLGVRERNKIFFGD